MIDLGTLSGFSLYELQKLPTLSEGQADDLKIDLGNARLWLSRCGVEDGELYPNKVTVEILKMGKWEVYKTYQAK